MKNNKDKLCHDLQFNIKLQLITTQQGETTLLNVFSKSPFTLKVN